MDRNYVVSLILLHESIKNSVKCGEAYVKACEAVCAGDWWFTDPFRKYCHRRQLAEAERRLSESKAALENFRKGE